MLGRKWTLLVTVLSPFIFPVAGYSQGNIYQDAIPHLKACISLIKEREAAEATTVDLREVCPTFAYFLTYEPISEIDPPLENRSSRSYLESLLALLETARAKKVPAASSTDFVIKFELADSEKEQADKPFFLALAHWMFAHIHSSLLGTSPLDRPVTQHLVYIATINFLIVLSIGSLILYLIISGRKTQLYIHHFKSKWQKDKPQQQQQPLSLDEIARLNIDLQIPALVKLVMHNFLSQDDRHQHLNLTSAHFLAIVTARDPQHARDTARLMRLHDRIKYSNKTVAADEVNHAFEWTRTILAGEHTP